VRQAPDDELLALVAETNDQRRVVGQSLWSLHRALVFGHTRGTSFGAALARWAPGAAQVSEGLERRLRRLAPHAPDDALRRFTSDALERLAEGLEREEFGLVPFLRFLEGRFPALTALMREEEKGSKRYDIVLARELRVLWSGRVGPDALRAASGALR